MRHCTPGPSRFDVLEGIGCKHFRGVGEQEENGESSLNTNNTVNVAALHEATVVVYCRS